MYQSKKMVLKQDIRKARSELISFLGRSSDKIYCKALKRFVFLEKLPECIVHRHDAKRRLNLIFVAFDILKNETIFKKKKVGRWNCFEISGLDRNGVEVCIHVREEVRKYDKKLYFVSCY